MVLLDHRRSAHVLSAYFWLLSTFFLCGFAYGQTLNVDQQIEVRDLPVMLPPSPRGSDVLLTSVQTIIHDPEVCCGKDSALEDSIQKADPKSLQDAATKLSGRHLLGDGRPIMVSAEFFPADKTSAGYLVTTMTSQHALLMAWDSHIYVVHGLIYFWQLSGTPDAPAYPVPVVRKLLLWDIRYSDARRSIVFNRDTDDLGKVQGFLSIQVKAQ